jgi:hypothetical protein
LPENRWACIEFSVSQEIARPFRKCLGQATNRCVCQLIAGTEIKSLGLPENRWACLKSLGLKENPWSCKQIDGLVSK